MNPDPANIKWNRRQFLVRTVKAGASIAAAGAAGLWFHDTKGPIPTADEQLETGALNFSIKDLNPKMAIVQGGDRRATLHSALKACLLYTSPSPRDRTRSRMPSSA